MSKQQEALRLALEALETHVPYVYKDRGYAPITAIKEALAQPDPYAKGYADAMNWKTANHLEHLPSAQPEQEPVAYPLTLPWDNNPEKHPQFYTWTWDEFVSGGKWRAEYGWKKPTGNVTNLQALYTTPPQEQRSCDMRTWVGLTDEEIDEMFSSSLKAGEGHSVTCWVRRVEAKLKEKNT